MTTDLHEKEQSFKVFHFCKECRTQIIVVPPMLRTGPSRVYALNTTMWLNEEASQPPQSRSRNLEQPLQTRKLLFFLLLSTIFLDIIQMVLYSIFSNSVMHFLLSLILPPPFHKVNVHPTNSHLSEAGPTQIFSDFK